MVNLTSSHQALIGFIGLGNMGAHMARNLIKKGHQLIVYDINKSSVSELVKAGAKTLNTPADIASQTNKIITMLPSHPHVIEVFTSKQGIIAGAQKSTTCLDCSTIDIGAAKKLAAMCDEKGIHFHDCPVSGGVKGAENATLTFMVGAKSRNDFETIKPILEAMGKNVVHAGDIGHGLAAKICNNMLLGISMIGVAETMNLGIKLGLDKKVLAAVLNTSSGRCWSSDTYNPVPGVIEGIPPSNNYQGGFQTSLITKDLSLAQMAATDTNSTTALGSLAFNLYKQMANQGLGEKDFAYVYEYI